MCFKFEQSDRATESSKQCAMAINRNEKQKHICINKHFEVRALSARARAPNANTSGIMKWQRTAGWCRRHTITRARDSCWKIPIFRWKRVALSPPSQPPPSPHTHINTLTRTANILKRNFDTETCASGRTRIADYTERMVNGEQANGEKRYLIPKRCLAYFGRFVPICTLTVAGDDMPSGN